MAISLPTTFGPQLYLSKVATEIPSSARIFLNRKHDRLQRISPLPQQSSISNRLQRISPLPQQSSISNVPRLRTHVIVSALSSSQGIESTNLVGEEVADVLDRVQVFDLSGNSIPISDLWKDRKAVVAFARHFGCVLCRKRADYLAAKKDRMDASGVALVLIGPGSVEQAKTFLEQTKFVGEVYADPSYSSYAALRFVSGVSTIFTPGAGANVIKAYIEGYRQDWALSFEKDTRTRGGWQQGGIIVAGTGKGNVSYVHRDKEAGDDPAIEDILRACCS